ncbi:HAD family hydrolase [Actinokineospora sp. G85]|uniref:HAD family hydrolase n=1 Tax=Actinokineospora sp. G85 TaxID=3406626 RepID=UPI003C75D346
MQPSPTTAVLWDVDLTLVDYSGLGKVWYAEALADVVGVEMAHSPPWPGLTERGLAIGVLEANDVDWTEEHVEALYAALVRIAERGRHEMAERGRVLPGVPEVLAALAAEPSVVQTLVTGNLPELAEVKLAPLGLHTHLDLAVGGYGALSVDRHVLVEHAVAAVADKYGRRPERVVVVGNTPLDVAGAVAHGAVAVGVATGRSGVEELAAAGAQVVFPDLSDTTAVLSGLLGVGHSPRPGELRSGA